MKHVFLAEREYVRLSGLVSERIAFLPISVIKKQIRAGEVRINGVKVLRDEPLSKGDEVRIFLPQALEYTPPAIETVYADDDVVIVAKPVQCETETHLAQLVQTKFGFAVPVHRLDRNTQGLVIFARSKEAEAELERLMKHHKIDKTYRALVYGMPKPTECDVNVYLYKDASTATVTISDSEKPGFVPARLCYQTVGRVGEDTVLEILLLTGRTHQIRATMAHLGHPVIGDGKYGIETVNRARRAKYQCLYAYKLNFRFEPGECCVLKKLAGKEIIWKNCELL